MPAPFCSDPDSWARSRWPKPSFPNVHHWHQVADSEVLWGNPRVFGFARNEMSRGQWGDPVSREDPAPFLNSGPVEQKRNPQ